MSRAGYVWEHIRIYIYAWSNMEKVAMNFKESKEGGKGREKCN